MTMLDGIRIVDLTSVIFGPYATQMLADLGADVIKVEAPMGDASRYLGQAKQVRSNGSVHLTVNRGKRSIVLDLKQPEDSETLRDLIRGADIFIHNVRGKAIARLGFSPEDCIALKPDLIYVHCAGFGQDGPYRDLAAYDDVIQAASGATSLAPRVDGNPVPRYIPSLIADKISGTYAAQAMLAALVHKLRTGEGQQVEVPMFEAFSSFLLEEHMCNAATIPPIGPIGYPRQLDPNRQPFPTADGHISIVPYSDAKIIALLALLGAPGWLEEMGWTDAMARAMNMTSIYAKIAELTPAQPTAHWMKLITEQQIAVMPVRDLADIFEDPHLQAVEFFRTREHPVEGTYREMRPPVRYSADSNRVLGIAPDLGQHGAEIREELRRHADKG